MQKRSQGELNRNVFVECGCSYACCASSLSLSLSFSAVVLPLIGTLLEGTPIEGSGIIIRFHLNIEVSIERIVGEVKGPAPSKTFA